MGKREKDMEEYGVCSKNSSYQYCGNGGSGYQQGVSSWVGKE